MSDFDFTAADTAQLERYLQDDPNDICKGIPHVIEYDCGDVIEIFSSFRASIKTDQHETVMRPFVLHVFEKALQGIFNRYVNMLEDDDVIHCGVRAWLQALIDLESRSQYDITDGFRQSLPDWDNGMIACAIIKACGRKLIEQYQKTPA